MLNHDTVVTAAGTKVILCDSISFLTDEDAGSIVVCASHGGASSGEYASRVPLSLVIFNDAGVGKDQAGTAALQILENAGVAAATVRHDSARIGDVADQWSHGVISRINRLADGGGLAVGQPVQTAADTWNGKNTTTSDALPSAPYPPAAPLILPCNGKLPRIHRSAWIAPTATIIGDVEIGADSSVFYGVVLRADLDAIQIGERTNVQDNTVIHVDEGFPCIIGDDVTVGHQALIHGARVGDGTLVGMSACLLSGVSVGAGSLLSAGAVVLEGSTVPAGSLAAGVPASVRRQFRAEEQAELIQHAGQYVVTAQSQVSVSEAVTLTSVQFG